jgi:hypothetical protein
VAPLGINTFSPFSPASFFANGEQGWWYDPSNFATLFQDSAGTTPVTAVEQPVGLQLDLSQGLALGPELITNGDFSNGTTGWTTGGTTTFTVSGGVATVQNNGADALIGQAKTGLVVGQSYLITATISNVIGGANPDLRIGTSIGNFNFALTNTGTGNFRYVFVATTTSAAFSFSTGSAAASGPAFSIDNISVKALPGNHRFQTTSANRPVVSARVNLLTKTEQFNDGGWTKSNVTVVANATTAPDGTTTADKIYPSSTGINRFVFQATTLTSGIYTWSIRAKAAEKNIAYIDFTGAGTTQAFFNLSTGTIGSVAAGYTATITNLGDGWYECAGTNNTAAAYNFGGVYGVADLNGLTTVTANGTDGIFIWGGDIRSATQGVGLPAYQRVNTSTDYDSTGFPVYIKPNGSNQFMQTNSINFTATDKMTVWQGVRKLSDAATGRVAEISVNAAVNAGAFAITAPEGAASNYGFFLRGDTGYPGYSATTFAAPVTNVLSVAYDISGAAIADEIKPRINGATPTLGISAAGPAGGGNFGNYPAYFYMRAGSSLPFNGNDYGSIARGAASTAAQITAGETYINSKTKAF